MQYKFLALKSMVAAAEAISLAAVLIGLSACGQSDVPAPGTEDFK